MTSRVTDVRETRQIQKTQLVSAGHWPPDYLLRSEMAGPHYTERELESVKIEEEVRATYGR